MKQLLIGIAVGALLVWWAPTEAKQPAENKPSHDCRACQSNYKECYATARSERLGCGAQCRDMLKQIRSARDAQGLMDAGQLVCADGTMPSFDFEGVTLDEVQAEYTECKTGCNEEFSEAREGCREERTVCLEACTH